MKWFTIHFFIDYFCEARLLPIGYFESSHVQLTTLTVVSVLPCDDINELILSSYLSNILEKAPHSQPTTGHGTVKQFIHLYNQKNLPIKNFVGFFGFEKVIQSWFFIFDCIFLIIILCFLDSLLLSQLEKQIGFLDSLLLSPSELQIGFEILSFIFNSDNRSLQFKLFLYLKL